METVLYTVLPSIEAAVSLVYFLNRYSFPVEVCIGETVINAKGLIGIMGLCINQQIGIRVPKECTEFIKAELKKFELENL